MNKFEPLCETDWINFWNAYDNHKDEEINLEHLAKNRVLASILKEKLDFLIKNLDELIKGTATESNVWNFKEFGKELELSYKKTSSIDPSILNELTDEECRKGYTVTSKAIELSGRKDLLEKYKTIIESKAITLKNVTRITD